MAFFDNEPTPLVEPPRALLAPRDETAARREELPATSEVPTVPGPGALPTAEQVPLPKTGLGLEAAAEELPATTEFDVAARLVAASPRGAGGFALLLAALTGSALTAVGFIAMERLGWTPWARRPVPARPAPMAATPVERLADAAVPVAEVVATPLKVTPGEQVGQATRTCKLRQRGTVEVKVYMTRGVVERVFVAERRWIKRGQYRCIRDRLVGQELMPGYSGYAVWRLKLSSEAVRARLVWQRRE